MGLYKQAAYVLCENLKPMSAELGVSLKLGLRVAEIHNKKIFDLLNKKSECFPREAGDGMIHIRGKPVFHDDGRVSVRPLSSMYATCRDEIDDMIIQAMKLRATGTSSLHSQSSRSHGE